MVRKMYNGSFKRVNTKTESNKKNRKKWNSPLLLLAANGGQTGEGAKHVTISKILTKFTARPLHPSLKSFRNALLPFDSNPPHISSTEARKRVCKYKKNKTNKYR